MKLNNKSGFVLGFISASWGMLGLFLRPELAWAEYLMLVLGTICMLTAIQHKED